MLYVLLYLNSLLLPYSLIQIFGASYLDTIFSCPSVLVSISITVASVSMCLSGFMETIYSYCLCIALSGLSQGPIWPACAKIMSNACLPNQKATMLGNLLLCIRSLISCIVKG